MEPIVSRFRLPLLVALTIATVTLASLLTRTSAEAAVTLPPAHAKFDYQIGGAYAAVRCPGRHP